MRRQRGRTSVPVSRRALLGGLCLGVGGLAVRAAFPLRSAACARPRVRKRGTGKLMLDKVDVAEFSPYVGARFHLYLESGRRIEVELIEAKGYGKDPCRPAELSQRESFSLLFRAPEGCALSQRRYTLAHEKLGSFELFLVPVGPSENGVRLEAVFN